MVQCLAKGPVPGLVKFIPALAYHFWLTLHAAFTQPGAARLLAELCTWMSLYNQFYCNIFAISIAAKDIYDYTSKYATTTVVVHEAVADGDRWPDQMEIVCPDVVDPGTFFLCHADIPRY